MDLRALPKVELHRHLEGSIRLETIIELSNAAGLALPAETPEDLAPHALVTEPMARLEDVLARFAIAQNSVRTYEAIQRISYEAVEDLAEENVRLAELRFSPDFLCAPGGLEWDEAMLALLEGLGEAASRHDVAVGLIAIVTRENGRESAEATVDFALRHRSDLVGFDLAGIEVGYPPAMFQDILRPIRDSGLGLTTHYGESAGPEYPREAVRLLGSRRLGHGLSVARDEAVGELVRERGVALEMCPISNWITGGVSRLADHPARRLLHQGLRVTLNSDDPGLFGTDLTRDLEVARDSLGFTDDDFRAVTRNGIEASFLPDDVKADARERHFGWIEAR